MIFAGMTGEMDFSNDGRVYGIDIGVHVEIDIGRAHLDIVDIEQQAAARLSAQGVDEFGFGHLVVSIAQVARRIFDQDRTVQPVLSLADFAGDMVKRFTGIGNGQQIGVAIMGVAAPAQMVGHHCRLIAIAQRRQLFQISDVEPAGAAQRQAGAVKAERKTFGDGAEPAVRRTAIAKIILGMNLDPGRAPGCRGIVQHIVIMYRLETDAA